MLFTTREGETSLSRDAFSYVPHLTLLAARGRRRPRAAARRSALWHGEAAAAQPRGEEAPRLQRHWRRPRGWTTPRRASWPPEHERLHADDPLRWEQREQRRLPCWSQQL